MNDQSDPRRLRRWLALAGRLRQQAAAARLAGRTRRARWTASPTPGCTATRAAADAEFARARRATASTGRFDLVAQAELVRCAARAAALDYDCPGFAALAGDATPAQRAYAAYLDGRWQGLDAAPAARAAPRRRRAAAALAGVADPLARLVAAGALFKAGRIAPADIAAAVDTASQPGLAPAAAGLAGRAGAARPGGRRCGGGRADPAPHRAGVGKAEIRPEVRPSRCI